MRYGKGDSQLPAAGAAQLRFLRLYKDSDSLGEDTTAKVAHNPKTRGPKNKKRVI